MAAGLLICWEPSPDAIGSDELRISNVMFVDPSLHRAEVVSTFDPRLKELWIESMRRPDSELQRLAADTISVAHRRGMSDLSSTADELSQLVQRPDTDAAVRRAAANALITLDARQHATVLAQIAERGGLEVQLIVEPALARWGSDLLSETWQRRLADKTTLPQLRLLAIEGLGVLRVSAAKPALAEYVRNTRAPTNHRISAARSLAALQDGSNLLEVAREMATDKAPAASLERQLAVYLVSTNRGDSALDLLTEMARDPEPAVAGAALACLFDLDPPRVLPLAIGALKSPDVNIRRHGVRALVLRGEVADIDSIASLLDDPNPSLRKLVTKSLFDLAQKPELRPAVVTSVDNTFNSSGWRGLEQASILAGHLVHKPAAEALIGLLKHDRPEVLVSAAWALGQLKIPETFPAALEHAHALHARHLDPQTLKHHRFWIHIQLSHLFQMFGEVRLAEADPLLRKFIPKESGLGESRMAACWALGKIHEGQEVSDLVRLFVQRLADVNSFVPEVEHVRMMCAIGLGRMKAQSALEDLRRFARGSGDACLACWWSIHELTGEQPPPIAPVLRPVVGWFLRPIPD